MRAPSQSWAAAAQQARRAPGDAHPSHAASTGLAIANITTAAATIRPTWRGIALIVPQAAERPAWGTMHPQELSVDTVFAAIEATPISEWMRGDLWAFPVVLILHTIGLAFLVGANVAVDVRILGGAPGVPLPSLDRYFLVAWGGFWINAASGVLLLVAYPTKALTNPVFYLKLALVAAAVVLMQEVRRQIRAHDPAPIVPRRLAILAGLSLACWAASITAGRLLAYTYTRLQVIEFL